MPSRFAVVPRRGGEVRWFDADPTYVLHFVNAYDKLEDRPDRGSLIRAFGVSADNVHIKQGKPDKVIVECAKELGAKLLVIGNSGRSGLSELINTNTAEKVLDELDCDLLALP